MAADLLPNIRGGADVFLDANIFVYALTGASQQCADLLSRCNRQDIFAVTSHEVINEATHRLMVSEAFRKGLIARARADDLRQRPAVVQGLSDYWVQVSQLFVM